MLGSIWRCLSGFSGVENTDNVGVIHRRGRLGFLLEALAELLVGSKFFVEYLDGNLAAQHSVLGHINVCHASASDELGELIASSDDFVTQWH